MVTAITSKLWDVVNSSKSYNFAQNPLPVFFMLYAKKHGVTFSFDQAKKCVDIKCDHASNSSLVDSFINTLSVKAWYDSIFLTFQGFWNVLENCNFQEQLFFPIYDFFVEKYEEKRCDPMLSKEIKSLVYNAVTAFYNNYSEDKTNPHWVTNYFFADCQNLAIISTFINSFKYNELLTFKNDNHNELYGGVLEYKEDDVSDFNFYYGSSTKEHVEKLLSEEIIDAATLCFSKDYCKTAEFLKWSKKIVEENLVNFVIDLPPLNVNHPGLLLIGVNKSSDYAEERQVFFVNGSKALKEDYTIDWDLIKRNMFLYNNFTEIKGELLKPYFRPDMLMLGDERVDYYNLLPTWPNDLKDDKTIIELSDVFELVPSCEKNIYGSPCLSRFNFSHTAINTFREFKEFSRDDYSHLATYQGKSIILATYSDRLQLCRWNSDGVFLTDFKNLVLRLKLNSPISWDYAIYALLESSLIQLVGYNMSCCLEEDNWHNFLKCKIAIHKDKAKQEEIVENLRNEYTQQRQKELEAEMQRLGIRTASSDMVHMLGPTFAKIESTLYDLKSEVLTATAQGAVEALNDNISYIKRFIKMAGADIMMARMSMKERKVNGVISSIQKSWANLSASRIFEVTYQSGVSDDVTFKIDESYFRVLFDTLFDNAYRHGFGKRSAVGNQVCITSQLVQKNRKEYVLLTVANNGAPFPEDFNYQKFISRGEYCGETGRTGLGGNHIYSILKRHDGFLYVTHNAEWNCIFEMLIPVAFQNDVESKNVCEYGNSSKCL